MDLAHASVFFDFDGTITLQDSGVHLLERLCPDASEWEALDEQYKAGTIGSRDCIERQWRCIPAGVSEAKRRAVAQEVPVDPGFAPLVRGLQASGAEVAIVSDGWGFYIDDVVGGLAEPVQSVPVYSNTIDFATNSLVSPYRDGSCQTCGVCGTCKPKIVREAANRGRTTVFVGDGTSDRHAARVADWVFAKGALARWCADEGIEHTRFDVLDEVASVLLP